MTSEYIRLGLLLLCLLQLPLPLPLLLVLVLVLLMLLLQTTDHHSRRRSSCHISCTQLTLLV
jgi:hypothetical protein